VEVNWVNAMTQLVGGVEAGGTKFVCAVGTGPTDIRAQTRFPTTTPEATLQQAIEFFRGQHFGQLAGIGVAAFGPLDLHPNSPTYGHITTTPKPGWSDTDLVGVLRQALNVPVRLDTDVNVAALGEWRWGVAQGLDTFIYLTIGTGIGGGGLVNGRLMRGLLHPEIGHVRVPHDVAADPFPGNCPFHADCLEGLASGPALEKRWGRHPESLPADHPAWPLEAHYLALALTNLICTLSPQRIILGGGVMEQRQLFPLIRAEAKTLLNNYIQASQILEGTDEYIVPPQLGAQAGMLGAIALASTPG
jgi:fructokinase